MSKLHATVIGVGSSFMLVIAAGALGSGSQSEAPAATPEQPKPEPASWLEGYEQLKAQALRDYNANAAKGYVKGANGNWGPPLPPGVFLKQDAFPPKEAPAPKLEPGHRGNFVGFFREVKLRPEDVATALKSCPVPTERREYYHELFDNDEFLVDGWYLQINDVSTKDGVVLVTLHSIPLVTSRTMGMLSLIAAFEETYELKDGKLKLVKTAAVGPAPINGFMN